MMSSENIAVCCSCGFTWRKGLNGSHSCSVVLRQKLNMAERALANLLLQIESVDGTSQLDVTECESVLSSLRR